MGFGQAIKICFSKYATFSGRASRSEYWFFQLFLFLCFLVMAVVAMMLGVTETLHQPTDAAAAGAAAGAGLVGLLLLVFLLGVFIPTIAVSVRRIHDTGASGWFVLLYFIPYAGWLVAVVWGCIPGTPGPNQFGPSPLDTPADAFT